MKIDADKCYFHDMFSSGFYYSISKKIFEIYFDEYYTEEDHVLKSCKIVICDWKAAYSKPHMDSKFVHIEENIGVVKSLIFMEKCESMLKLSVDTCDNRYVDFMFDSAVSWVEEVSS